MSELASRFGRVSRVAFMDQLLAFVAKFLKGPTITTMIPLSPKISELWPRRSVKWPAFRPTFVSDFAQLRESQAILAKWIHFFGSKLR